MAADLQETLGRPATVEEIAKALELPKKKLAIVKKAIKVYNLVPQTDQPENGWSLGEMLMDERTRTPDVRWSRPTTAPGHATGSTRWTSARRPCFGCGSGSTTRRPKTLKEIGESLGLTRERVRQIENEALGKLSASMQAD